MSFIQSKNKQKILICDDDPTYLMLMRDTLETAGFSVYDACNGEDALKKYALYQPDMLLLDVKMPILGGFEVCETIRATPGGDDIPILMITGIDDFTSIEKAYAVGATDFLPKPIKWPMMAHRVKYMLRSRDALRNLKSSEDRLRYLAYNDTLTGLPNRQHFTEHLNRLINIAAQENDHIAIIFIDLDRFKRINDTLGHGFGDKVLQQVANRLDIDLRKNQLLTQQLGTLEVVRLGGDEFAICLNHVRDDREVTAIAKQALRLLSEPIQVSQYEVVVTPSIGISFYPNDGKTVDELLKNADSAMYYAKDSGRGCFKLYSDSLNSKALDRLKLEESLRIALKEKHFELYYQPQVDCQNGEIISVEALIRWQHPELGLISPADFIPLSEETGMIIPIGQWVLETACLQAKSWLDNGLPPVRIAINISGLQFKRESFINSVKKALIDTQLPPHLLELELTESVIMSDVKENIMRLHALKALGVSLAIDDFGTGYSSLNYLKRFPIDVLKIDRCFINDIATNEEDHAIVAAILALAKSMNLKVVAEGVETINQLHQLQKTNCSLIQGFFFSRPTPADECTQLLHQGLKNKMHRLISTN